MFELDITLTLDGSMIVGDMFRIGLRRDADHATLDDASGDCYFYDGELYEVT